MRKGNFIFCAMVVALCSGVANAQTPFARVANKQVVVKLKPATPSKMRQWVSDSKAYGYEPIAEVAGAGVRVYEVRNDQTLDQALQELRADPDVEYAEPNYVLEAFETPNDPMANQQWSLAKTFLPDAWSISHGSSSVTIAIVDTGVDLQHQDLSGKVTAGYDFIGNDTNPTDEHGHGTHCAGIAGANWGNNKGIAGVGGECRIMPVRVLDENGSGLSDQVASGIIWAVDHGANVISLSLGGPSPSSVLNDAVNYAWEHGAIVVCAAGNDGTTTRNYPAAYTHVISVGASTQSDGKASFSNYGDWVTVAAPGEQILSTLPGNQYGYMSGTSMATPHVAGLVGLIWGRMGLSTTNTLVRQRLELSCDNVGSWVARGRVNALKAMNAPETHGSVTITTQDVSVVGTSRIRFRIAADGVTNKARKIVLSSSDGNVVKVPATTQLAANKIDTTLSVLSQQTLQAKVVTITAQLGDQTASVDVTINPFQIASAKINRESMPRSGSGMLTVTGNAAAPKAGLTVELTSSRPDILPVPSTLKIRALSKTATLKLKPLANAPEGNVTITATLGGVTKTTSVMVRRK
jgi:thermitase